MCQPTLLSALLPLLCALLGYAAYRRRMAAEYRTADASWALLRARREAHAAPLELRTLPPAHCACARSGQPRSSQSEMSGFVSYILSEITDRPRHLLLGFDALAIRCL